MLQSLTRSIREYIHLWRAFFHSPYNVLSTIIGVALLETSYRITTSLAVYATKNAGAPLNDIVFSYIGRVDTSIIHGDLSFLLFDLRYILFFILIYYAPFATKALAFLILFRACVINLTQLGMPDGIVPIASSITFGGDLFFSGHVANTFMLALIFWDKRYLRFFFIGISIVFGIAAVIGRYHYSIDVIAAPFFAYGIFAITKKWLRRDYTLLQSGHKGVK